VREEALERDGFRCQITGFGGPEWAGKGMLEVDHWLNLGAGGSQERDKVENCITLQTEIHRTHKHGATIPKIRIVHWDPDDPDNELVVERRSLEDGTIGEWEPYPKFELWFFRRPIVAHVFGCLGNMNTIQNLTGFHALTMFELRLVWKDLYEDAASFDQVVSSFGWDPGDAHDLADKHIWMMDHKAQWPEGLTNRQLTEIIKRDAPMTLFDEEEEHPTETMQAFLSAAAEKSFTDLKNALIAKKLKFAQPFYYVVMPAWMLTDPGGIDGSDCEMKVADMVAVIQSRDEEGLKKSIRDGEICEDIENPVVFRMGKAVMNLTSVRNSLRLKDEGKTRISVIQWPIPEPTATDMLASVPEAYGGLPEITQDDSDQMFDDKTDGKTSVKEDDDEDL